MSAIKVLLSCLFLAVSRVVVNSSNVPTPFQQSSVAYSTPQLHKSPSLVSKFKHTISRTRFIPRHDVRANVRAFNNDVTMPINATTASNDVTTVYANATYEASTSVTTANATTASNVVTTVYANATHEAITSVTTASTPTTQQSVTTLGTTTSTIPHNGGGPVGCRKVSACVCETQSGQKVDLTPLGNTDGTPRFRDLIDPSSSFGYSYSWNPCHGFNEGTCQNVAACQAHPSTDLYYNLGEQTSVDFEVSSSLGFAIKLTADGTVVVPQRITYIRLQCDPDVEGDFTVQGEPVVGTYYFTLRSRYACLTGGSPTTPPTPPTAHVITFTDRPRPTTNPIYSLETVVDLLFVLTVVAVVGLVVLLLVLTVICFRRGMTARSSDHGVTTSRGPIADFPPQYECHDKKQLLGV
ncbi:uncharacterized protein [Littorina saxatilis]|uniref:MRH domain-containing protein n=1 Tax=Littorina saxatilis TaxID=31220 RepID=A0AAN9GJ66_9CAEN